MKINEETTVSEEQVLFNKLKWEEQQFILKQMRMLQPCELSCEIEEQQEHKIPEKTKIELLEESDNWCIYNGDYHITDYKINPEILDKINSNNTKIQKKLDEIIDFLKSKGDK